MIQKLKSNGFINIVLKTFLSRQIPFPSISKVKIGAGIERSVRMENSISRYFPVLDRQFWRQLDS